MERERGAALLMALLLAVLVAVLAGGMMRDEQRRLRLLDNQRSHDEAQQLGEGALDWVRLILRDDLRMTGARDHWGEVWALPISDIPLSTVLGGTTSDIRLSGRIIDAQSRFNLMSLIKVKNSQGDRGWVAATEVNPDAVLVFERLLSGLGLDPSMAMVIAQQLLTSRLDPLSLPGTAGQGGVGGTQGQNFVAGEPLPLGDVSELAHWFPDADAVTLQQLVQQVVLLPRPTPVNANTASAVVMAAVLGVDPGQLVGLMQQRTQQYFMDTADLQQRLTLALPNLPTIPVGLLGVSSDYFYVLEELRQPGAIQRRQALVARHPGVGGQITQVLGEHRGWTLVADQAGGG